MQLSDIAPNVAILKSPSNWFLVAFAVALMLAAFFFINRNKD